jgi:methionine--tRNA ligase beta chain
LFSEKLNVKLVKNQSIYNGLYYRFTKSFNPVLHPYFVNTSEEEIITYDDFLKVHLKIGKVVQAEHIPGMKKILEVKVDIGDEQRNLAVGAALHYKPEELVGRFVVVCTNLEAKKIGGVISNGMLLAADGNDGRPVFLTVSEEVPSGSIIH